MKEEKPNWSSRSWDDDLPPPEDLTPLSQSLITPDLALAFDIPTSTPPPPQPHHDHHTSSGDDQARTLKRPRLVWTPQLHKRFVDAVAHLGIKNAVPKTIMQLMSVDGLTRENVASHLQKYRLYLKRMQSLSACPGGHSDLAMDKLFAAGPVPHSFIGRGTEQFQPFGQGIQPPQHQMVAAVHHPQFFRGPGPTGGFVPPLGGGMQRLVGAGIGGRFAEEAEIGASGRKVLTLFPTNDG